MTHECKFCGKKFNAAYYINKKEYTCGECSVHCIKKCPLASSTTKSRSVAGFLQKCAIKYDIPKEVMHPHSFRHFFAMEFIKRKNDIALLADLLGHGSVNVTQIYLRQSREQQKDVVDEVVNW